MRKTLKMLIWQSLLSRQKFYPKMFRRYLIEYTISKFIQLEERLNQI